MPNILNGSGLVNFFNSTTVCQFDLFYSEFDDSGATLYATTPNFPNADYTIELQNVSGQHIKSITNSTSTGVISENWNLTDDNNNVVTNEIVKAVFTVDPASRAQTQILRKFVSSFSDGNFTIAYAWDDATTARNQLRTCIQNGVVDPLISVAEGGGSGSLNPYYSTFNDFTSAGDNGNPGYLSDTNDVNGLLNNLASENTRNFYFYGHGSPTAIGNKTKRNANGFLITSHDVAALLGNHLIIATNAISREHPYRFVFLDACNTASDLRWANAFGVLPNITSQQADAKPGRVQALLGWKTTPGYPTPDGFYDKMLTEQRFFNAWMGQSDLITCINAAQDPNLTWPLGYRYILPNGKWNIYGYPWITRTGHQAPH